MIIGEEAESGAALQVRPGMGTPRRSAARVPIHPAVVVQDFSFSYSGRPALRNLSFSIERRAVTAIIGPSGCGKSTFLRSINRLNDLTPGVKHQGDILVEGTSVFGPGTDLVSLRQRGEWCFSGPIPSPRPYSTTWRTGPPSTRW
jgi:phosphate transport system ATP-binding protein